MSGIAQSGRPADAGEVEYKVVELTLVTDGEIERVLNEWTAQGWVLETIQFAMRESSRRPAMAFVCFARRSGAQAAGSAER